MDLDAIFKAFVNPETIFLSLSIYVLTHVWRKVVVGFWPQVEKSRYWSALFLPLSTILVGAFCGLAAKTFVWPERFGSTLSGRMLYGAICGIFAAFVYGRVRSFLEGKAGTDVGMLKVDKDIQVNDSLEEKKEESK
jgi:uncharacterized membrane protein YeaQ/YmgE (transglycosylase-associated protein family)